MSKRNRELIRGIVQVYISQAEYAVSYEDIRAEIAGDYPEADADVLDRAARAAANAVQAMFNEMEME